MRTSVDLDDDILEATKQELGTKTTKDTVNAAMAFVLEHRRHARSQAASLLDYWGADIVNPAVMDGARQ